MEKIAEYLFDFLEHNDFSREYSEEIITKIRGKFTEEEMNNKHLVMRFAIDLICENVFIDPCSERKTKPDIITVVGPTASGKTSTIIKMIAEILSTSREKEFAYPSIKVITSDCIHVASTEKLERCMMTLGVTVEKVNSS